jgi:hypothetical protein
MYHIYFSDFKNRLYHILDNIQSTKIDVGAFHGILTHGANIGNQPTQHVGGSHRRLPHQYQNFHNDPVCVNQENHFYLCEHFKLCPNNKWL